MSEQHLVSTPPQEGPLWIVQDPKHVTLLLAIAGAVFAGAFLLGVAYSSGMLAQTAFGEALGLEDPAKGSDHLGAQGAGTADGTTAVREPPADQGAGEPDASGQDSAWPGPVSNGGGPGQAADASGGKMMADKDAAAKDLNKTDKKDAVDKDGKDAVDKDKDAGDQKDKDAGKDNDAGKDREDAADKDDQTDTGTQDKKDDSSDTSKDEQDAEDESPPPQQGGGGGDDDEGPGLLPEGVGDNDSADEDLLPPVDPLPGTGDDADPIPDPDPDPDSAVLGLI